MSTTFKLGDLVWAKMKGFSPWPGRVSRPTPELKAPKHSASYQCIYFFGSNNYAWIKLDRIKPYLEFREKMMRFCNTAGFKDAINQIEECIECPEAFDYIDGQATKERYDLLDENKVKIKNEPEQDRSSPDSNQDSAVIVPRMLNPLVVLDRVKIFECEYCGQCFLQLMDYQLHKLRHVQQAINNNKENHNNDRIKNFKCEDCNARFVLESTLIEHSTLHAPFPHICECGIGYYRKKDLDGHRLLVHPSEINTWKPKINYTGPKRKYPNFKSKSGMVPKLKAELNTKINSPKPKLPLIKSEVKEKVTILKNKDNKFVCPICNKTFASKMNATVHVPTHYAMEDRPHGCDQCDKRFTQVGALNIHLKRHAAINDYICQYCNKGFPDQGSMKLHERIHTGVKPYECKYCGKAFSDPSAFSRHTRTHTGVKPYVCKLCPKKFSDASALIQHVKRHGEKEIKCDMCGKMFYNKHAMDVHKQSVHYKLNKYECDICGKRFNLKSNIPSHIETMHTATSLYCCDCMRRFRNEYDLKKHKAKGCVKKLFECDYCRKQFFTKNGLLCHILLHSNKKRKTCKMCNQVFSDNKGLKGHLRLHHYIIPKDKFVYE